MLVTLGLAALIAHKRWGRGVYVRHRELIGVAACLQLQCTSQLLAVHGGSNVLAQHRGSELALLVLMTLHSTVFWVSIYALRGRLAFGVNQLALPLLTLPSLLAVDGMCGRVLEAPGVKAPLARLHDALALAQ